jgi:NitT/TauT family transport system permease protein
VVEVNGAKAGCLGVIRGGRDAQREGAHPEVPELGTTRLHTCRAKNRAMAHAAAARPLPARSLGATTASVVVKRVGAIAAVVAALWGLWEGYRWLWMRADFSWPFVVDNTTMPHVHDILGALFEPSRVNGPLLIRVLLDSALFTAKEAGVGFLLGASIGFTLGVVLAHSRLLQRGFLPYIVASQTIPILAIAPMVVVGLGSQGVTGWVSVSVIAAYLTFFPVTINTVRGLQSADPRALELMKSYAAGRWRVLWKLRVPSALPYLFSAFKVAATASVVGAIVGELPSSIQDGLGGAILNFNQYYITGPEKLWATNVIAALLGISFFLVVVIAEKLVVRQAPEHVG